MTQYNLCTTRRFKDKDGKVYKQWGIIESFQDKELAEKELALMRNRHPKSDWRIDALLPNTGYFPGLGDVLPQLSLD
tara:strand:+ start:272 stop:502 length:231 start_codon:yes stop_codon:yes gene_type:complete